MEILDEGEHRSDTVLRSISRIYNEGLAALHRFEL